MELTMMALANACVMALWIRAFTLGPTQYQHLGKAAVGSDAVARLREAARTQYVTAFWLVVVAATVAVALWAYIVLKMLNGEGGGMLRVALAVVGGSGSSALFGYLLRVWREAREFAGKI